METMMRLILDGLYCLVALCAGGFFVAMIYTDIKNAQINSRCKINISRCQDCKSDYCTLDSSVAPGYHICEGKPKTMRI